VQFLAEPRLFGHRIEPGPEALGGHRDRHRREHLAGHEVDREDEGLIEIGPMGKPPILPIP